MIVEIIPKLNLILKKGTSKYKHEGNNTNFSQGMFLKGFSRGRKKNRPKKKK
jgi:hypothetical protein